MITKFWGGRIESLPFVVISLIGVILGKIAREIRTFFVLINVKKAGRKFQVLGRLYYRYPSKISFGNNVSIGFGNSFSSENIDGHHLTIYDMVSIGNENNIDFSGGISLYEGCHIAHRVLISTHDHGYDYKAKPIGIPLEICQNAFIGSQSIIMHNVRRIGVKSVVAAGAIVTKDVPDYAIVAGNPAKVIKIISE